MKRHRLKTCSTLLHWKVFEFKLYDFMTEREEEEKTSINKILGIASRSF